MFIQNIKPIKAITINGINFYYIKGYEGYYAISKCSKVYSIPRVIIQTNSVKYPIKGRILKTGLNSAGYLYVILCKNKKTKHLTIHRLVVESFIGEIPKGLTVNHKDGNKQNNNLSNLEIITYKENTRHAMKNGLHRNEMIPCLLENINTGKVRQFESIFLLADFLNVCNVKVRGWLKRPHLIRLNKYKLSRL